VTYSHAALEMKNESSGRGLRREPSQSNVNYRATCVFAACGFSLLCCFPQKSERAADGSKRTSAGRIRTYHRHSHRNTDRFPRPLPPFHRNRDRQHPRVELVWPTRQNWCSPGKKRSRARAWWHSTRARRSAAGARWVGARAMQERVDRKRKPRGRLTAGLSQWSGRWDSNPRPIQCWGSAQFGRSRLRSPAARDTVNGDAKGQRHEPPGNGGSQRSLVKSKREQLMIQRRRLAA